MNILYIAYSCSPNHGSEDRIGWQVPLACGKDHKVFVITKEEHRAAIEEYRAQHPELQIQYHYVDIPAVYKKMYKGFAYSGRLNIWHKRAVVLAQQLCRSEKIDIIHQITPVEFRSIGDYGKIPDVKFVCGPVGGGEYIPVGLKAYAGRHMAEELLRAALNRISLIKLCFNGALSRCDTLLFANEETKRYLSAISSKGQEAKCMTEIGIASDEIVFDRDEATVGSKRSFLVAGRLIYRKGHGFLLDALKELPKELDYTCTVLGSGPELQRLKKKCRCYGLDGRVQFKERVPFHEMEEIYRNTHVLIMPSIRETTGSVLLEAMSKGLPIVTVNGFGGAQLVTPASGWRYDGRTKKEFIEALKAALTECIEEPASVYLRGQNAAKSCQEHTWGQKVSHYLSIYRQMAARGEI
jgi:glycosyltransferase involved in cell wall biosynthesis